MPVAAVADAAGLEKLPEAGQGELIVPVGVARAHHVAVGIVDVEGGVDGEVECQ